jgi:hypothetical protein
MRTITIRTWEALSIYGLGLAIGFCSGYLVRWAWSKP